MGGEERFVSPPATMKALCVFCGSSPGSDPDFADMARALGTRLAERGIGLVYGGGNVGLMGIVADACLEAGGEVQGVIPEHLLELELAHQGVTKLHVVGSMHERKALMNELADGFISLPGGIGTLEEMFETLTWSQLGIQEKPCGLLDVDGYFSSLREFLDRMVEKRFLLAEHRDLLLVDDEPDRLIDRMQVFERPGPGIEKWVDRHTRAEI